MKLNSSFLLIRVGKRRPRRFVLIVQKCSVALRRCGDFLAKPTTKMTCVVGQENGKHLCFAVFWATAFNFCSNNLQPLLEVLSA
jgi:hypothetical protein